ATSRRLRAHRVACQPRFTPRGGAPAPMRCQLITKAWLRTRHERALALRVAPDRKDARAARSAFRGHSRDEGRKRRELLLDEAARSLVLELAGLFIEFGRAVADEDLRLVEREGVEKHHRLAQIVLHARAADRSGRNRLQRHGLAGE